MRQSLNIKSFQDLISEILEIRIYLSNFFSS